MIALRNTWFLLLVLTLTGCGMKFVKPETPEQRLMYLQSQIGSAYKTVADLRAREAITKPEGKAVIAKIDEADKIVKGARTALDTGDISTAEGQISAAVTAMLAIESTLKAKQ